MTFFIPYTYVTLCQLYSITSLVFLKISNYGMMKMKIFCVYGCFIASRYSKGGRKSHRIALNAIAFLDTHVDKVVEL